MSGKKKKVKKKKKVLNLEGLVTYPAPICPENSWHAKAINFKEGMDVSDYESLRIRARGMQGGEKIKIQLVSSFQEVNNSKGLWPKLGLGSEELSQNFENIEIPLSEFKNLKVNLKKRKIYRLAIHYGKEAWGEKLNDTNTKEIIIEEIEFISTKIDRKK